MYNVDKEIERVFQDMDRRSIEFIERNFKAWNQERQPESQGCHECCLKCCCDECPCIRADRGRQEEPDYSEHMVCGPDEQGYGQPEMTPEQWEAFNAEDRGSALVDAVDGMLDSLPAFSPALALDAIGTGIELVTGTAGAGLIASAIGHCIERD